MIMKNGMHDKYGLSNAHRQFYGCVSANVDDTEERHDEEGPQGPSAAAAMFLTGASHQELHTDFTTTSTTLTLQQNSPRNTRSALPLSCSPMLWSLCPFSSLYRNGWEKRHPRLACSPTTFADGVSKVYPHNRGSELATIQSPCQALMKSMSSALRHGRG